MPPTSPTPMILCFIADIFFAVKVEQAVKGLGYSVEFIERTEQVAVYDFPLPGRQYAEHLVGPGAVLIERISAWQPALMIFDLNNQEIPWREWVALLKSVPATRRIPVICFGSHVEAAIMQEAKGRGADAVVARSRFSSALPELIQKYSRIPDYSELENTCKENLPALAVRGIEEFNRGEYFEAHESLEEAWLEDQTPGRELYRAILQVAVAYLQIERQNYAGAIKMFLRVRQWISPLPDRCRGVDVALLRDDARRAYDQLVQLGPERISEFDRELLRPVGRIVTE